MLSLYFGEGINILEENNTKIAGEIGKKAISASNQVEVEVEV